MEKGTLLELKHTITLHIHKQETTEKEYCHGKFTYQEPELKLQGAHAAQNILLLEAGEHSIAERGMLSPGISCLEK